jgi:hypothetical protein
VTVTVADANGFTGTGTLTIQANQPNATLTLNPASVSMGCAASGGTVTLNGNAAWTVTPNQSWITIPPGSATSGTGSGQVSYSVSMNIGASRSGTVTIGPQTLTVTQAAGAIAPRDYIRLGSQLVAIETPGCQ